MHSTLANQNADIFSTYDKNEYHPKSDSIVLLIDLLKNDIDANTSTFLDLLTSNLFVPHIIHPTRITPNTKTLIDNIFSNSPHFYEGISGNITLSISDHINSNEFSLCTFKNLLIQT